MCYFFLPVCHVPAYATPDIGLVLIDVLEEPTASIFKYENP
jgi:hypothetical protein